MVHAGWQSGPARPGLLPVCKDSDEFGVQIMEQLSHQHVSAEDVEDVVICSVVPKIMYSLTSGIKKYLHCEPMIVGQGTKTGIRIATTNPAEIGAGPCGRCGGSLLSVWWSGDRY